MLKVIEGFDYLPLGATNTKVLLEAGGWQVLSPAFVFNSPAVYTVQAGSAFAVQPGRIIAIDQQFVQFETPHRCLISCGGNGEGYIGLRLYVGQSHNGYGGVTFWDSGTGDHVHFAWTSMGVFTVYRGDPRTGTVIGYSDPGSYLRGQWFNLEVYMKKGTGGAGALEIRVNTQTVLLMPSVTTISDFNMVGINDAYPNNTFGWREQWYIDDFRYNDTAGSVNNSWLGNARIITPRTTGNSTPLDFTIGGSAPAATNWQSVQNEALDGTKYVYTPTVGDRDLYTVQAIVNAPLVHAVQLRGAYSQDDATQLVARNTLQTGTAVDLEGADYYTNATNSYSKDIVELNPDTGVGWTGSEVNALKIGPKLQASV